MNGDERHQILMKIGVKWLKRLGYRRNGKPYLKHQVKEGIVTNWRVQIPVTPAEKKSCLDYWTKRLPKLQREVTYLEQHLKRLKSELRSAEWVLANGPIDYRDRFVDVVGLAQDRKIAIECGSTYSLGELFSFFDEVYHIYTRDGQTVCKREK